MESKNIKISLHEYFQKEELKSKESQELIIESTIQDKYGYDRIKSEIELPCKVGWCSSCGGSGTRSKYDIEGYDIDRMITDEDGDTDYEFKEDYFSGKTDIGCNVCEGTKIKNIIDYDSCNEMQVEVLKENSEIYASIEESDAIQEAERRMGA